ncbi:SMI1/KNR4 family protein [Lysobacter hankyongensis]|uniref:Knr4/Smi1-like domain-containing protein n=1 Tax=Lysobacter hankyongensis TaxID=1176535 RepID=A0ABP9C5X2_9GAMM
MASDFIKLGPEALSAPSAQPEIDLLQTERDLDIELPQSLRQILLQYAAPVVFAHGARFRPDTLCGVEGRDGHLTLLTLYGPGAGDSGLLAMNRMYSDQVPPLMAVIGESPGGNQLCIERTSGRIYFWNHEAEHDEAALTAVAESFDAFRERLVADEGISEGTTPKIDESKSFLDF